MANESASEVVAIINAAADAANLPRQLVLGCAYAESRLNPLGRRPSDPSKYHLYWSPPDPFDISGGLGQKIVRYMQPYLAWCQANGRNPDDYPGDIVIDQMLDLLNDPREASRIMCADLASKWRLHGPNMEKTLAAYNWPAGGGAFYTLEHAENYRTGLTAAARILGTTMPKVTYNPQEPAHAQDKSFDCSQESLEWALWSLGRKPDDGWMERTMMAEGVMSADLGLLDATGKGLAEFVTRQYGEFGFYANNEPSISFDDAALEGGHTYPLLIGGRRWGHWSGLKGYDAANDLLILANPANGWQGVGQTMNRAQFDALGPFSMVRVLHPDLLGETVPDPEPTLPAQPSRALVLVGEIESRLAELKTLVA